MMTVIVYRCYLIDRLIIRNRARSQLRLEDCVNTNVRKSKRISRPKLEG